VQHDRRLPGEGRIDRDGDESWLRIQFGAGIGASFALSNWSALAGSDATSFAWRIDLASGAFSPRVARTLLSARRGFGGDKRCA